MFSVLRIMSAFLFVFASPYTHAGLNNAVFREQLPVRLLLRHQRQKSQVGSEAVTDITASWLDQWKASAVSLSTDALFAFLLKNKELQTQMREYSILEERFSNEYRDLTDKDFYWFERLKKAYDSVWSILVMVYDNFLVVPEKERKIVNEQRISNMQRQVGMCCSKSSDNANDNTETNHAPNDVGTNMPTRSTGTSNRPVLYTPVADNMETNHVSNDVGTDTSSRSTGISNWPASYMELDQIANEPERQERKQYVDSAVQIIPNLWLGSGEHLMDDAVIVINCADDRELLFDLAKKFDKEKTISRDFTIENDSTPSTSASAGSRSSNSMDSIEDFLRPGKPLRQKTYPELYSEFVAYFPVQSVPNSLLVNLMLADRNLEIIDFEITSRMINNAIIENKKVLVICAQGRSRSVAVIIAYLMRYKNMSLTEAKAHVKKLRPQINPENFMQQLQAWERAFPRRGDQVAFAAAAASSASGLLPHQVDDKFE
jgi:hypothetical protein